MNDNLSWEPVSIVQINTSIIHSYEDFQKLGIDKSKSYIILLWKHDKWVLRDVKNIDYDEEWKQIVCEDKHTIYGSWYPCQFKYWIDKDTIFFLFNDYDACDYVYEILNKYKITKNLINDINQKIDDFHKDIDELKKLIKIFLYGKI